MWASRNRNYSKKESPKEQRGNIAWLKILTLLPYYSTLICTYCCKRIANRCLRAAPKRAWNYESCLVARMRSTRPVRTDGHCTRVVILGHTKRLGTKTLRPVHTSLSKMTRSRSYTAVPKRARSRLTMALSARGLVFSANRSRTHPKIREINFPIVLF